MRTEQPGDRSGMHDGNPATAMTGRRRWRTDGLAHEGACGCCLPSLDHGVRAAMGTLTTREREVLVLLGAGSPNRLIARSLGTSERTAKAHVSRILTKLGVASRLEAALAGIRHHDAICPDRNPHEP